MTDSDATQGDNMSPAQFAKLMGAYPQPAENPLPTYGGFMDNSAANFSWVQNNDYFGAETEEKEMIDLLTKGKVALKQFVAYDDRDFKDFCKEEDLDYNDPNALQEYVETYDDVALIEMLNDDEQGRYYELKESFGAETFESQGKNTKMILGITALAVGLGLWKGKEIMSISDKISQSIKNMRK